MIHMIEPAKKITEMSFVYLGTLFHFVGQLSGIEKLDTAISIAVGVLVCIYTITRIYDWWKKRDEKED